MSFGSRIRKAREYQCLNQRELAELLGVAPSAIANYENDYSVPTHNVLVRMFSVLEIDANYLYYDYLDSSVKEKKTILSSDEVNMLKKNPIFTDKIIESFKIATLSRWSTEIQHRVLNNYMKENLKDVLRFSQWTNGIIGAASVVLDREGN